MKQVVLWIWFCPLSPPPNQIPGPGGSLILIIYWLFGLMWIPVQKFVECKKSRGPSEFPRPKKFVKCKSYGYPIGPPVPKKIVKCKSYGVPTVLASMSYNVPTCQFHPPKPLNVNHEFWHLMFIRPVCPSGVHYITFVWNI